MAQYESDITKFIRNFLQQHPEEIASQKKGRAIWWDKSGKERTPPPPPRPRPQGGRCRAYVPAFVRTRELRLRRWQTTQGDGSNSSWLSCPTEIRHYPTPIARCDEQLADLLERRARVLAALRSREDEPAAPGCTPEGIWVNDGGIRCRITCTTRCSR
jgi:hypothetical protein